MAKKYSINWENEEPVSFEVDGVTYELAGRCPKREGQEQARGDDGRSG